MATQKSSSAGKRNLVRAFQIFTAMSALLYFNGCATGNYKKADAASDSLRDAVIQIDAENRAIDVTLARLDDLVNKPSADLKPQFKKFGASLDRLVGSAKRAEKAAAVANQRSVDYFQSWDKQTEAIKFEAVRDQSVSRKTLVSNEFNTVNERYRENQAVIEPLISYLQDIHTALGTDLTAGGLQSVKPLADNAEQNALKVQTALTRLCNDLTASRTQMSSVVLRETPAKGGVVDTTETTQQSAQSPP